MSNTEDNSTRSLQVPLVSIKWLKYLGLVFLFICIYVIVQFYFKYQDDVIPKSLTFGQHLKLSIYAVGTLLPILFAPLLFFSAALIYRKVRVLGINPIETIKRDLLVIIPLCLIIWTYLAYFDEPVSRKFSAMMWTVQELKPGEEYVEDQQIYELMEGRNLNGLYDEIDSLDLRIETWKSKAKNNSMNISMTSDYIESLKREKTRHIHDIWEIYLIPIYTVLFMFFGLLLGYIISLRKWAFIGVLIVIGIGWNYLTYYTHLIFSVFDLKGTWFFVADIGILIVLNVILFLVLKKSLRRPETEYL